MKKLLILFFCAFLVIACSNSKSTPAASSDNEINKPSDDAEDMEEDDMEEEVAEEAKSPIIDGINAGQIYKQSCAVCHGLDGKLGANGSKDLSLSVLSLEEKVAQITNGKGLMTPFGSILKPEEIQAVAKYTMQLKQ